MSTELMGIEITVNGQIQHLAESTTVLGLLKELNLDPARVAVELDRHIVKQGKWGETLVAPGAQLEIVQFVGGG